LLFFFTLEDTNLFTKNMASLSNNNSINRLELEFNSLFEQFKHIVNESFLINTSSPSYELNTHQEVKFQVFYIYLLLFLFIR
jgi:hypothetical protein